MVELFDPAAAVRRDLLFDRGFRRRPLRCDCVAAESDRGEQFDHGEEQQEDHADPASCRASKSRNATTTSAVTPYATRMSPYHSR